MRKGRREVLVPGVTREGLIVADLSPHTRTPSQFPSADCWLTRVGGRDFLFILKLQLYSLVSTSSSKLGSTKLCEEIGLGSLFPVLEWKPGPQQCPNQVSKRALSLDYCPLVALLVAPHAMRGMGEWACFQAKSGAHKSLSSITKNKQEDLNGSINFNSTTNSVGDACLQGAARVILGCFFSAGTGR